MKTGLAKLTYVPSSDPELREQGADITGVDVSLQIHDDDGDNQVYSIELENDELYLNFLKGDVVGSARKLVTACRASGQRRDELRKTIEDGNAAGGWVVGDDKILLRVVELLKDVDTRWSSIFNMIDRVLELYPVRDFPSICLCIAE